MARIDSLDAVGWAVSVVVFAAAMNGYFDDNKKAVYGDTFHAPVNCRAYVQATIDGIRSEKYTFDDAINGLERNCGINGQAWQNNR